MSIYYSSPSSEEPTAKTSTTSDHREEIFLDAFMSIAQKVIVEWEHLRETTGENG